MKSLIKSSIVASLLMPVLALAQSNVINPGANYGRVTDAIKALGSVVNGLTFIAMSAVLLLFFWGVAKYITAGADEEKRAAARSLMIYGVIGVFVVFSIWGLVALLGSIFGVGSGGSAPSVGVPKIPSNL
jgi:hypothetical protein